MVWIGILMNWTGISNDSLLGKIMRLPLRLIPRQAVVPILQGPLRGKKWIVGSGNHGYWLGSYEIGKRALFVRSIPVGAVVYDLGANVGYYTLLAAMLAGAQGKVFAFEPLPRNLEYLRRHLALNRIENAVVIDAAVADQSGTVRFEAAASTSKGRIGAQGGLEVRAIALDDWIEQGKIPPPAVLKIDIEGAELQALQGARKLLAHLHPTIFLSTHSGKVHKDCLAFLETLGYRVVSIDGRPMERSRDVLATFPGS
jgi:FkbM family methyltransferase